MQLIWHGALHFIMLVEPRLNELCWGIFGTLVTFWLELHWWVCCPSSSCQTSQHPTLLDLYWILTINHAYWIKPTLIFFSISSKCGVICLVQGSWASAIWIKHAGQSPKCCTWSKTIHFCFQYWHLMSLMCTNVRTTFYSWVFLRTVTQFWKFAISSCSETFRKRTNLLRINVTGLHKITRLVTFKGSGQISNNGWSHRYFLDDWFKCI